MLQALAAFSGGIWVQHKISELQFPQLSRARDEGETFKLTVRIIAASIPGLDSSGLLTRERPRISAVLGDARKETEFGDSEQDILVNHPEGNSQDPIQCPWHFGEELTFAATIGDILGQGVQIWVRSYSDFRIGPFQVNLARTRDVGVCTVDLKNCILPECAQARRGDSTTSSSRMGSQGEGSHHLPIWESPLLTFPLTHVGGSSGSSFIIGQAAGHVLATFSVNADPKALLQAASDYTRPLADRLTDPFKQLIREPVRWVVAAAEGCHTDPICGVAGSKSISPQPSFQYQRPPFEPVSGSGPVVSDLAPEGWVSYRGPNGREFWHHLSLGPPPWDRAGFRSLPPTKSFNIGGNFLAGTEEDSILKLPSKDQPVPREGSRVFLIAMGDGKGLLSKLPIRNEAFYLPEPSSPEASPVSCTLRATRLSAQDHLRFVTCPAVPRPASPRSGTGASSPASWWSQLGFTPAASSASTVLTAPRPRTQTQTSLPEAAVSSRPSEVSNGSFIQTRLPRTSGTSIGGSFINAHGLVASMAPSRGSFINAARPTHLPGSGSFLNANGLPSAPSVPSAPVPAARAARPQHGSFITVSRPMLPVGSVHGPYSAQPLQQSPRSAVRVRPIVVAQYR